MGSLRKTDKVKLIVGLIASSKELLEQAIKSLARAYGATDFISGILPFDQTDYYEKEMGQGLQRQFVSFAKLIGPEKLPAIKIATNKMEWKLSGHRTRRKINLDPGYLNFGKLVLATTKDHQHRLYLGKDIFGEVTLKFTNGTFQPWTWTYPDYASQAYINIFNHIRQMYQQQIRN